MSRTRVEDTPAGYQRLVPMRDPTREHAERRIRSLSAHLQWASALHSQPGQPSPWSPGLPQHPQIARSLCKSKAAHREEPAHKVLRAEDAAALVSTGDIVTVAGFVGTSCPEVLLNAVRARYDAQGEPSKLQLVFGIAVGDGKGRGMDRLAEPGLVSSLCYAWVGVTPGLVKLVNQDKVKAWNLPLGCVVGMIRAVACGGPGPVTKIGLGTFADPRDKGGKLNRVTTEDIVRVVKLGGEDFLWYRAPPRIDVALLRGTTADLDGNVSFEKEALLLDQLNQAMAAHNSGGKVIVQVERLAKPGCLHPRSIHLPASIVDAVVLAPSASLHQQTLMSPLYSAALSGEMQAPLSAAAGLPAAPERRIIAHRAFLEIDHPGSVVNLGVGMPEGVSAVAASLPEHNPNASGMSMSTEAGVIGGFPRGGLEFGTAVNAGFFTSQSSILDFYNGGGIDIACLGMAEVDGEGNVNVSNFGEGRMPGCGGFVDISQCARKVVFLGTLTSGGLKVAVEHGQLRIVQEGRARKFRQKVVERTFAGSSVGSRSVLFITERAVFRLRPSGGGLELVEVAPGVDVQREVLGVMDCQPAVSEHLRLMDPRIFQTFSSA